MLNIDSRLLDLIPEIGIDALVILLLMARAIGGNEFANERFLQRETKLGRIRVKKALEALVNKKLLKYRQLKINGKCTQIVYYQIKTDLIQIS